MGFLPGNIDEDPERAEWLQDISRGDRARRSGDLSGLDLAVCTGGPVVPGRAGGGGPAACGGEAGGEGGAVVMNMNQRYVISVAIVIITGALFHGRVSTRPVAAKVAAVDGMALGKAFAPVLASTYA